MSPLSQRPRSLSRTSSTTSGPYVPNPENLILPDGAVSERAAELLGELVLPHDEEEHVDADADYRLRREHTKHLPWWKTPSPWWLLSIIPFTSIAMSATIAPKIEIYTLLACSVHKPDIFRQTLPTLEGRFEWSLDIPLIRVPMRSFEDSISTGPSTVLSGLQNDTRPPDKSISCASDPTVQAAVAKLSAVITACMGILSCLTTAWWGSFSDRYGRTRVMGISVIGLLLTDVNFIFVTINYLWLPGGYWFLLLGPLVEGSLGGMTSAVAAMHAYQADTSPESMRSRIFSLSLGLLFAGMAIGPSFGALLISITGKTLSVFYAAGSMHFIYALLVWFVIPEPILKQQMLRARMKYQEDLQANVTGRTASPVMGLLIRSKRLFAFLSPLSIFLPEIKGQGPRDNPLKHRGRDWSLTLLAVGYGLTVSIIGSYTYKFQYAASTFGWGSETLGYWISLIGAARAVFLTLILPVIIRMLKPRPITIELTVKSPPTERQALLPSRPSSDPSYTYQTIRPSSPPATSKTFKKEINSPIFDIGLARSSLFVELVAYMLMAFAPTAMAFTLSSLLGSLGAGFSPATQSVALALYTRRGGTESGRLFGALSVISALCSQILGPAMYGLLYMKTVATHPRTIFFMSTATAAISFSLLALVRLPEDTHMTLTHSESLSPDGERHQETQIRIDEPNEITV